MSENDGKSFAYKDLLLETHPQVYDPAEDTYLLAESVKVSPSDHVLEIGTGCGLVALDCSLKGASVVCTDINPFAVQLTGQNIQRNRNRLKGTIEVRQGNLFSVLKPSEVFDVVVFNPPYLPTLKKERVGGWFDVATDGGKDGLKITKRFIHGVKAYLRKNGRMYFVFSSFSDRNTLETYLRNELFSYSVVASQRFEDENLEVYCCSPTD